MAQGANEPTLASAISGLNDAVAALQRTIVEGNNQRQQRDTDQKQDADKKKSEAEFKKNVAVLNRGVSQVGTSVSMMVTNVKRLSDSINALAETQRRLGVSLTTAVDVRIGALAQSTKSQILAVRGLVDAIKGIKSSLGPPVRPQDILEAQQAYAEEFGAIISSAAGRGLAQQASQLGVSADKIVKSTRIFMGASLNDYNRALAMQSKFMTSFRGQGLAPRAAFEAIIKYSDLIARNGDRFALGFARAAADAKKIGADLNKIEQFADSMVDDFEGFLEKQGELAAMGFRFDSSRLLAVSASGNTEQFVNELRSQLATTGKNLENLNRFERRAIENAFGINIGEIQRLAGVTPNIAGGGDTMENTESLVSDIKKLLEGSNNPIVKTLKQILDKYGVFERIESLLKDPEKARTLIYGLAGTGGIIGIVVTGLSLLVTAVKPLVLMFKGLGTVVGSLLRVFGVGATGAGAGGAAATLAAGATRFLRIGQGLVGGVLGFMEARQKGASFMDALGAGAVRGGTGVAVGAAFGGVLGSIFGPLGTTIGTLVGGFVGDVLGDMLNEKIPELKQLFGSFFSGAWDALKMGWTQLQDMFKSLYEDAIKPATKQLTELFYATLRLIGGNEEEGMRKLQGMFKVIGFTIGRTLIYPLQLLLEGIKTIVTTVEILAAVLHGDFSGAFDAAARMAKSIGTTLASPFVDAYNWSKEQQFQEELPGIQAANMPRYAMGGLLTGPGTGTSDSILARLSTGEYVLNAEATKTIGPKILNVINKNPTILSQLPGFAKGGLVTATEPTPVTPGWNSYPTEEEKPAGNLISRAFASLKSGFSWTSRGFKAIDEVIIPTVQATRGFTSARIQNVPQPFTSFLGKGKTASIGETLSDTFFAGFRSKKWADAVNASNEFQLLGKFLKNAGSIIQGIYFVSALASGDYRGAARSVVQTIAGKVVGTLVSGTLASTGAGAVLSPMAYIMADIGTQKLVGLMFDDIFPPQEVAAARKQGSMMLREEVIRKNLSFANESTGTNAPRMHDGGIVGATGPNEIPAILEQGEAVFTAAQYDRFRGMAEGAQTPPTTSTQPVVKFDTARLEAKLDMMIQAIATMEVKMDGTRVGNVLARTTDNTYQIAALRQG